LLEAFIFAFGFWIWAFEVLALGWREAFGCARLWKGKGFLKGKGLLKENC
jgi:hypothetical protein